MGLILYIKEMILIFERYQLLKQYLVYEHFTKSSRIQIGVSDRLTLNSLKEISVLDWYVSYYN